MRRLPPPGDASGRVVVITGGSSGIGAAAARAITTLGGTVALVGRNEERTRRTAAQLGAEAFTADYGRLHEVRDLAERLLERYPRIHVLANNAGGINPRRERTVDGSERTLQESVLGGFLLTELLLPRLLETAEGEPAGSVRVVATASAANLGGRIRFDDLDVERRPWLGGWTAYNQAKLANIALARDLARRLAATGVASYSFHPGLVRTRFGKHTRSFAVASALTGGRYGISPEQGAEPLVRLATAPDVGSPTGTYFTRLTADGPTSPQARDATVARRLRRVAEERTGLRPLRPGPPASTP
ncbi:SDR family NAD(P)-dependent oxidoreductase [Naasia sp. SYSU D00057]|uniref:SDR family NAD(P)-dependent oxidoreductase n=1 Tax=Naasia sp. SYSU D00057 TaxID=2817380 RepID=UPI001B30FC21|nr:SDR family NAD(P)-dependent oxidoreductase [Naasia sp. SYSU D00057]